MTGISGDLAPKISVGQEIVKIDPRYFRPSEVETLLGDPSKAKAELGWEPKITAQRNLQRNGCRRSQGSKASCSLKRA